MAIFHNAVNIVTLYYFDYKRDNFDSQVEMMYNEEGTNKFGIGFKLFLIVATVLNSLAILFLGHLIRFHIILKRMQITTFEYLMIKKNRANRKSKIFRDMKKEKEDKKK